MSSAQKTTQRTLNPCNDFAFKRIFGDEKHKDRVIDLLNAMLSDQLDIKIQTVAFLSPIQLPDTVDKKESAVDLLCEDQAGNQYIVEMQVLRDKSFLDRVQHYGAKTLGGQMKQGELYTDLKRVIVLAITDFTLFPKYEDYRSVYEMLYKARPDNKLDKLSFTFVELTKFREYVKKHNLQVEDMSWHQQWCQFLDNDPSIDRTSLEELAKTSSIKSACTGLERINLSESDLWNYEAAEKRRLDWASSVQAAAISAREQGKEEGEQVGLKKGKEEGKIEIAEQMLSANFSQEQVCTLTGLDATRVAQLAEQLGQ